MRSHIKITRIAAASTLNVIVSEKHCGWRVLKPWEAMLGAQHEADNQSKQVHEVQELYDEVACCLNRPIIASPQSLGAWTLVGISPHK